jgi:hypothetical protein
VASTADGTRHSTDRTFTTSALPSTTKPRIRSLRVNPRAFRAAGAHQGRHKTGTTITYQDSRRAITTLIIWRCLSRAQPTSGEPSSACTRFRRAGKFTHNDRAGPNRFHFDGRIRRRTLRPGSYRLDATPRAAGHTGKTVSTMFTILG